MDYQPSRQDDTSDATLLAGLRAGDDGAFRQLVRTHGGRLLAVARGIVDDGEAADCVQEAFLQAFRKIDTFKENSSLATWLHRIVVNAALMRRRQLSRQAEVSLESLMPVFDETGCRVEPSYSQLDTPDLAEQVEVRAAVLDAMSRLPDESREIIVLRDVQGLDTEQTAAELEITTGAAKVRLHRARAAMKKLLEPTFGADAGPGGEG